MSGTVDHEGTDPAAPTPGPQPYVAAVAPRRGRRALLGGLAVLAVGAGAFGVVALSAGDGADSPEDAVTAMFDAIDQEDAIGVAEALDPRERAIVQAALDESSAQAKRVELASGKLDLRKVEGIDLRVEGVTMTTERLGDGVTAVDLTGGTVRSSADIDRLPVGAVIQEILDRDAAEEGGPPDRTGAGRIELDGVRLVATEADGGWHVSAVYSLAEQIRRDQFPDEPVPTLGQGIGYQGASSPEQAVRDAVDAARTQDVRRLIELTPPGEADALHDYGPILVRAAGDPPEDPNISVEGLELATADGPDGTKVVSAESFDVRTDDEWGATSWVYDGECTTTTTTFSDEYADEYEDEFGNEQYEDESYEVCDDENAFVDVPFFALYGLTGPAGQLRVVTEEHDGAWYVSPTRSIVESTVGGLKALDADDVRRLARSWAGDWWASQPERFWEACGVDQPALDASSADGEAAWERCYEQLPDDYDGYGGFFGSFGPGWSSDEASESFEEIEYEPTPSDRCYEESTGSDEVESCLRELVATGEIDAAELADFVCGDAAYATIDEDATDAEWEAADEAFEACLAAADDLGAPTPTTIVTGELPPGSTTVPAAPTTTAVPPDPTATSTPTTRPASEGSTTTGVPTPPG